MRQQKQPATATESVRRPLKLWQRALQALPFAVLLAIVVYYIMGPSRGFFHSDCADTMFWAQAIVEGGRVLNPDFYYAAILPFGANFWFVPLISLFGVTMLTQTLGMAIFALVFMLSAIFLFRSLQWRYPWRLLATAALMLILSSSEKLREIMWGHVIYYSLILTLVFLGLGLIIRLLDHDIFLAYPSEGKTWRSRILLLLLILLAAGAATNGFQMIAMFLIPLAGALIADQFADPESSLNRPATQQAGILAASLAIGSALGLILLAFLSRGGKITAGYANAFSLYSSSKDWFDNAGKFLPQLFALLGIGIENGTSFVSFDSLVNLSKVFGALTILICPLLLLLTYRRISDRPTRLLLWVHLFITAVTLFTFIFGRLANASWRLTPFLGSSILVTVAALRHFAASQHEPDRRAMQRRLAAIAVFLLILPSCVNGLTLVSYPFDYIKDQKMAMLSELLARENLTYGYATFWHAQALTVMTDSRSKVRVVNIPSGGVEICDYQSNKNWYLDQADQSEYFLLMNASEYRILRDSGDWPLMEPRIIRQISEGGFEILVFGENIWGIID